MNFRLKNALAGLRERQAIVAVDDLQDVPFGYLVSPTQQFADFTIEKTSSYHIWEQIDIRSSLAFLETMLPEQPVLSAKFLATACGEPWGERDLRNYAQANNLGVVFLSDFCLELLASAVITIKEPVKIFAGEFVADDFYRIAPLENKHYLFKKKQPALAHNQQSIILSHCSIPCGENVEQVASTLLTTSAATETSLAIISETNFHGPNCLVRGLAPAAIIVKDLGITRIKLCPLLDEPLVGISVYGWDVIAG